MELHIPEEQRVNSRAVDSEITGAEQRRAGDVLYITGSEYPLVLQALVSFILV